MRIIITLTEEDIKKLKQGEQIDISLDVTNKDNFRGVVIRKEDKPKESKDEKESERKCRHCRRYVRHTCWGGVIGNGYAPACDDFQDWEV